MKKPSLEKDFLKTHQREFLEKNRAINHNPNNNIQKSTNRKQMSVYTRALLQNNKHTHKRIQIILDTSSDHAATSSHVSQAGLQLAELIGCQIAHDISQPQSFNSNTKPIKLGD
ncbi:hypothetical protein [Pseudochrobactrum asaccharolyticum]|uniref:hypothetical protein n=1 Tax=Pseudochrobactrum asaccharolyticum TaxID=354351 RepID=UPI000DE8671E|nr:hypothetical protein [Pseudochrobactrum asaccharolyticum]